MRTIKLIGFLSLVFLSFKSPSHAQQNENRQFTTDTTKLLPLNIYDTSNTYPEELLLLDDKLKKPNLTRIEKSKLLRLKGAAHYELNQIPQAIQAFQEAMYSGGLTDKENRKLGLYIAKLWIILGNYKRGAEILEQWGRDGYVLKPNHVEIIMQAWLQDENYQRALPWAERWYNEAEPKRRKHYDLMNFIYNNLRQSEKQIEIIKAMKERWPDDKVLWDSLASLYANNGQEREAFEVGREYYLTGNPHTESEILRLVQHYSHFDMTYDAARILEEEIEAGRVTKTLKNKVWLSILYQDAGYDVFAEMFFDEAVEMSNKIEAQKMRETLIAPNQIQTPDGFEILSLYPDFTPPKTTEMFKIVVSDRDAQPLVRIPPFVPKNAKKSGYCKVRFNVDTIGKPVNAVTTFCTEKLFEVPAIKSATVRSDVETIVKFRVKDNNRHTIPE